MVEARWNGTLIAIGEDTIVAQENHYFPMYAVTFCRKTVKALTNA